jgi:hypothetical protein
VFTSGGGGEYPDYAAWHRRTRRGRRTIEEHIEHERERERERERVPPYRSDDDTRLFDGRLACL